MNLILLHERDRLDGDRFRLADGRARHVLEVLGAGPGAELRVGLLEGPLGTGVVGEAQDGSVDLRCTFDELPPPRPPLDLLLAVPRPKSLAKLLPQVAALGVDRLVLMRTWRVGKPYLTAKVLEPETYLPLLYDGLMQARCTRLPQVTVEPLFRPFIEDRAPAMFEGRLRLVAHPGAERPLSTVRVGTGERVALAIGPEGGFLPFEIEKLVDAGFEPVSMGPRTLRVETACVALLSQLDLLRRVRR